MVDLILLRGLSKRALVLKFDPSSYQNGDAFIGIKDVYFAMSIST
jgi:hypothetical protein